MLELRFDDAWQLRLWRHGIDFSITILRNTLVCSMKFQRAYWFPAKTYGWGWGLPVTWQGWLVLLTYTLSMIIAGVVFPPATQNMAFITCVAGLSLVLVVICWLTGEPPRWRWGRDN